MSDNKKYYWLKLQENFFEDDTMKWIEEQENGKDYIIFYLKLALKSLEEDGKLIRYVGQKVIPYDVKALAKLTNTSVDTVAVALKTFFEIGLVEKLESGELYLNQINELVGSETDSARRMRKMRSIEKAKEISLTSQSDNNVQKSDTEIEKEKEKELEKELDTTTENEQKPKTALVASDSDRKEIQLFYQNNIEIMPSAYIMDELNKWIDELNKDLVLLALKKTAEEGAKYKYAKGIMLDWHQKGYQTLDQVEKAEVAFRQSIRNKSNYNKPIRQETEPKWAKEDYEKETDSPLTAEEQKELDNKLAKIQKRREKRKKQSEG